MNLKLFGYIARAYVEKQNRMICLVSFSCFLWLQKLSFVILLDSIVVDLTSEILGCLQQSPHWELRETS